MSTSTAHSNKNRRVVSLKCRRPNDDDRQIYPQTAKFNFRNILEIYLRFYSYIVKFYSLNFKINQKI